MKIDDKQKQKIDKFINDNVLNINWEEDSYKFIINKLTLYATRNLSPIKQNKAIQKVTTHAESVRELASYISIEDKEISNTVDSEVLEISSLFHDIGKICEYIIDNYIDDEHAMYSEFITKIVLQKQNKLSEEKIKAICKSIKYHSYKGTLCPKDATINDKILMDADLLDEKCGVRYFELCMIKYSDEVLLKLIKERVKRKEEKCGKKLSTKQFLKIIEKCRRENLNNEDFSELFDIIRRNNIRNQKKILEKCVCEDITFPVYKRELHKADLQFSFMGIYEFTNNYIDKLNRELIK